MSSSLRARAASLGRGALDLLFPPRCGGCNSLGHWLCPQCREALAWLEPPLCTQCGIPLRDGSLCRACANHPLPYLHIRSAVFFEGAARQAVHRLKYVGRAALAAALAQVMLEAWEREHVLVQAVVPVPLHPERLRERGYNQAEVLARQLARLTSLPLVEAGLRRTRNTPPQVGLSMLERQRNVEGAFWCQERQFEGQTVLLVDDVCTTGSTLRAAAQALHQGGAVEIWALTLARSRPG
ncbi:MAG: double zinc ribbon domain-containing protein [Anaerolineae bacterium]